MATMVLQTHLKCYVYMYIACLVCLCQQILRSNSISEKKFLQHFPTHANKVATKHPIHMAVNYLLQYKASIS
jgi:hypothetical protein